MNKMSKLTLILFVIFSLSCRTRSAMQSIKENYFPARQMGQVVVQCFGQNDIINCFENELLLTLDRAIANNETWQLTEFLTLEKISNNILSNEDNVGSLQNLTQSHSKADTLAAVLAWKMLQLAQVRSIRLQVPASSVGLVLHGRSIETVLDDVEAYASNLETDDAGVPVQHLDQEIGTLPKLKSNRNETSKKPNPRYFPPIDFATNQLLNPSSFLVKNNIERNKIAHPRKTKIKIKKKNSHDKLTHQSGYPLYIIKPSKGRKKKDNPMIMRMLAALAVLGLILQTSFVKVMVVAVAAFVMAKIALLLSVLGSLKGTFSGIRADKEHVIFAGIEPHDHASSWHRRSPYTANKLKETQPDVYKLRNSIIYYNDTHPQH